MIPFGALVLIDDDDASRRALARSLVRVGYEVVQFAAAVDALAAGLDTAAAVITDLHMPGVDGWQLVRAIRYTKPDLPVILISGALVPEEESDDTHGAIMLEKPFSIPQLCEVIEKAIEKKHPATKKPRRTSDAR